MLIGIFFASAVPTKLGKLMKAHVAEKAFQIAKYMLLLMLFYMAMIRIVSGTYNPFIYFQF